MKDFYNSFKAIVTFLIITLVFTMITDEKTSEKMVLIVLLGMLLLNSEEFITFLTSDKSD